MSHRALGTDARYGGSAQHAAARAPSTLQRERPARSSASAEHLRAIAPSTLQRQQRPARYGGSAQHAAARAPSTLQRERQARYSGSSQHATPRAPSALQRQRPLEVGAVGEDIAHPLEPQTREQATGPCAPVVAFRSRRFKRTPLRRARVDRGSTRPRDGGMVRPPRYTRRGTGPGRHVPSPLDAIDQIGGQQRRARRFRDTRRRRRDSRHRECRFGGKVASHDLA